MPVTCLFGPAHGRIVPSPSNKGEELCYKVALFPEEFEVTAVETKETNVAVMTAQYRLFTWTADDLPNRVFVPINMTDNQVVRKLLKIAFDHAKS